MPKILTPYWQTSDESLVKLYHGDAIQVLSQLPSQVVQTAVTSPPYWGLRDYETDKTLEIGSERTPDEFLAKMVAVFREVRRVLRDDGTLWFNLGDSYASRTDGSDGGRDAALDRLNSESRIKYRDFPIKGGEKPKSNLKSGNLVGMPWRVALALQADGWILRQDIIWAKPSPMPESVRNRCTKAHEYLFLLVKRSGYFYDADAIKEGGGNHKTGGAMNYRSELDAREFQSQNTEDSYASRNKRSVWNVSSQGYEGAHFATFPPKLIEPCVLAGTSERGACVECGAPWRRIVEERKLTRDRPNDYVKRTGEAGTGNSCANSVAGVDVKTIGWRPTCECGSEETRPCIVLDPFIGSGTTCCVAIANGRRSIGIDLSEKYLRNNAIPRIEGELITRPALAHLTGRKRERIEIGTSINVD